MRLGRSLARLALPELEKGVHPPDLKGLIGPNVLRNQLMQATKSTNSETMIRETICTHRRVDDSVGIGLNWMAGVRCSRGA